MAATAKLLKIDLSWNVSANVVGYPVTGCMIEKSTDGESTWYVTESNTGNMGTTYSDTSVLPLTTYTYRVF